MHTQQQDILAATTTDARNVQTREMLEGVVVSGSWDAAEGVCQVLVGDSIPFENANFADGNQPFMPLCTLVSPAIGQQYAPVGGERALIWESQGSWVCWLEHGPDDTDSTLASGEFQVRHRSALNPSAFEWDSALKLTNDGPTAGDNLGGTHVGGVGAYTVHTAVGPTGTFTIASDAIAGTTTVETPAGHLIQTADAAGSRGITIQSATGLLAHLDDVKGQILSQVAPELYSVVDRTAGAISHVGNVGLGALFADLVNIADSSAARQADIRTLANNIVQQTLQTLATAIGTAAVTAAIPNAGPFFAIMSAAGWVKSLSGINPAIPDCSSAVKIE